MKRLLFFLMAIMFAISGWTQTTVTIGTGTSTSSSGPIPGYYGYHNSALLFTANEMTQGGVIQSFGLDISTAIATSTRSLKIYLKEVSDISLASSQIMNNLLEGATLVYDSTNVNCSSLGWRMFNFSTPFLYSGAGNLLVITTGAGCASGGGCSISVKYATTPTGMAWTKVVDNANINFATSTANSNTYRYNSRFSIADFPLDYCSPPSSLLASNIFHSSANLTWTSRVSADSWTIEYKPSSSSTWLSETSTTNSFSLIGLAGSTTYNVRVKSNCSGSSTVSLWSNITFTTPTSCPAPTSLTVPSSSLTYSEALLTWKPTVNPATWDEGYLIQYKPSNIISWDSSISISSVLDTSYLLTGLLPSKTYNVRIKAVCNPGIDSSAWTSTTNFTTLLSCPAPTSLTVPSSNINFTEALLTWRPTKNPATWNEGYLIQYKPSTIISWDSSTSISSILDTSYLLTGLLPSKTYNVRIKAVCNPGTDSSAWTSSTSFNTLLSCPAPTSLVVPADKIRNNKALLTWKPTVNPYTWNEGYLIQYKPSTITDWALATTVSSIQDTSYLLQGLTASTTYNVRMRAVCNPGTDSSAWTTIATFNTDCDPSNIFPWTESFESITVINTLPACWSATRLGTYNYTNLANTTYGRNARTGTKSASFKYGCNDKFTSPTFELTADNNYVFTFWYVTDGLSGWQNLQARVRGIDDNSINEIIGTPVINATNSVYTQYVGIYTPTVSGQYKFDIEC
ncbi:MAG: fibronectin type III domain-containing protein, partial [Bacteroidales bacterium]|nr:fibronectin type III domain-containing protein [Bacteroidales bacterium]